LATLTLLQMSYANFPAGWLRVLVFVTAAISVGAFVTVMSISGHVPKAIAYSSNPLYAAYLWAPSISEIAGVASVVLAIIALRGSSWGLQAAVAGVAIGIVLFLFVTILAFNLMSTVAPPPMDGKVVAPASFPLLVLSPPLVGIAGVAIAAVAALSRLRGVSGLRLAIASLVMGGVVTAYWLFNLLIMNFNGE